MSSQLPFNHHVDCMHPIVHDSISTDTPIAHDKRWPVVVWHIHLHPPVPTSGGTPYLRSRPDSRHSSRKNLVYSTTAKMPAPDVLVPEVAAMRRRLQHLSAACPASMTLPAAMQLAEAVLGEDMDLAHTSHLFDALQLAIQADKDPEEDMTCFIGTAAALQCAPAHGPKILLQFLDACFLPLLCTNKLPSHAVQMQVGGAVCRLLVESRCWAALFELLERCSLRLHQEAGTQGNTAQRAAALHGQTEPLPLHTTCCLVPSILAACSLQHSAITTPDSPTRAASLTTSTAQLFADSVQSQAHLSLQNRTSSSGARSGGLQAAQTTNVLGMAVQALVEPSLVLLGAEAAATRTVVLHAILPCLVAAAQLLGPSCAHSAAESLVSRCRSMLQEPGPLRRAALAALVQQSALVQDLLSSTSRHSSVAGADQQQQQQQQHNTTVDLFGPLYEPLAHCLAGRDALDRKRAVYLLQQLMPDALRQQAYWKSWLCLHSLLEEFGMHLIKPAWPQINGLHAPDEAYRDMDPVPAHISHKRNKLRSRKPGAKADNDTTDGNQAAGAAGGSASQPGQLLAMGWLCVLWQRGLQHENFQVQRLALRSFLQRAWSDKADLEKGTRAYSEVPTAFVADVLIPSLTQEFVYSGPASFDCQTAACRWLACWLTAAPGTEQRTVAAAFLDALCTKGVPRSCLHKASAIWSGCLPAATQLHTGSDAEMWAKALLPQLDVLCNIISNHQGQATKQHMYACMLSSASMLVPARWVGPAALLHLLARLPMQAIASGGPLNSLAKQCIFTSNPLPGVSEPFSAVPGPVLVQQSAEDTQACVAVLQQLLLPYQQYDAAWPSSRQLQHGDMQELSAISQPVATLACLVAHVPSAPLQPLLQQLQADLPTLYDRAYLPAAALAKRLVLLHHLCNTAHTLACEDSPLQAGLCQLAKSCAQCMAAYASLHIKALFTSDSSIQSQITASRSATSVSEFNALTSTAGMAGAVLAEGPASAWIGAGAVRHLPELTQQVLLAQISLSTCSQLLELAVCARGTAMATPQHTEHLAAPLTSLLTTFLAAQPAAHSSTGLNTTPPVVAAIQAELHAAQLLVVQAACQALGKAAEGAAHVLPQAASKVLVAAGPIVNAVMRAADVSPTAGVRPSHQPQQLQWSCLDAVLSACSAAQQHAASNAVTSRPIISFAGEELCTAPIKSHKVAIKLVDCLPGLSWTQHATLLSKAIDALGVLEGEELLPVLRVLRVCWVPLLRHMHLEQVQEAVAGVLHDGHPASGTEVVDGPTSNGNSKAVQQCVHLCWHVLRALCATMSAANKRRAPLCAALVNTLLLPQLFDEPTTSQNAVGLTEACQDVSSPTTSAWLQALHSTKGPVPWALNRLLDWGASSARITLLVACQTSSLLTSRPWIITCYGQQLQRLLMYGGSRAEAAGSYEVDAGLQPSELPAAAGLTGEEGAMSPQQVLLESVSGTEVAPRAVLLCGLHHLAIKAGCVWRPVYDGGASTLQTAATQPAAIDSQTAAAHDVAGYGTQASSQKPPVIIFHDAGDWVDLQAGPASMGPQPHGSSNIAPQSVGVHADLKNTNMALATDGTAVNAVVSEGLSKLGSLSMGSSGSAQTAGHAEVPTRQQGAVQDKGSNQTAAASMPQPPAEEQVGVSPHVLAARAAGFSLWQQLLDFALSDPDLSTDKIKFGSDIHRRKVRVWQALAVLTSFVQPPHIEVAVQRVLAQFTLNEAPSVKQYQETAAAALLLKQPELVESLLLPLLCCYEKHHAGVGSFILLAAQVILHSTAAWRSQLLPPLLMAISPWLTCHTHNVRTFAQLITHALLVRYPPDHPLWAHQKGDLSYLSHFMQFCDTNQDLVRLRRTIGAPILSWSPEGLAAPTRLLGRGVCLAGQTDANLTFEGAPPALMDHITNFLMTERYRLREEISDRLADIEYLQDGAPPAASQQGAGNTADHELQDFQRKVMSQDQAATVQVAGTKAGPGITGPAGLQGLWQSLVTSGLVDLMQLAEQEQQQDSSSGGPSGTGVAKQAGDDLRTAARATGTGTRQELIVVASLVDKLPNLAGLARTCEVFRAAQLVVPDIRVASDPTFSSISVTAEQWVPMVEVQEQALLPWLARKQADGYTLVGLEQTADSVRLPEYQFPARCVLVLGREKEGMPPEVMNLLDDTVEIPQLGLIRSLNVHVSGAIAMYEYTKQQLSRC